MYIPLDTFYNALTTNEFDIDGSFDLVDVEYKDGKICIDWELDDNDLGDTWASANLINVSMFNDSFVCVDDENKVHLINFYKKFNPFSEKSDQC